MINIIGQEKLVARIATYYSTQFLPKTLMFLGPTGCGKHLVAKYVAETFKLDYGGTKSFCVLLFLLVGNRLHSACKSFPEFQTESSCACILSH